MRRRRTRICFPTLVLVPPLPCGGIVHSIQETWSSPALNGGIYDAPVEDPVSRESEFIGFAV